MHLNTFSVLPCSSCGPFQLSFCLPFFLQTSAIFEDLEQKKKKNKKDGNGNKKGAPGESEENLPKRGAPGESEDDLPKRGAPGELEESLPKKGAPGESEEDVPRSRAPGESEEGVPKFIDERERESEGPHEGEDFTTTLIQTSTKRTRTRRHKETRKERGGEVEKTEKQVDLSRSFPKRSLKEGERQKKRESGRGGVQPARKIKDERETRGESGETSLYRNTNAQRANIQAHQKKEAFPQGPQQKNRNSSVSINMRRGGSDSPSQSLPQEGREGFIQNGTKASQRMDIPPSGSKIALRDHSHAQGEDFEDHQRPGWSRQLAASLLGFAHRPFEVLWGSPRGESSPSVPSPSSPLSEENPVRVGKSAPAPVSAESRSTSVPPPHTPIVSLTQHERVAAPRKRLGVSQLKPIRPHRPEVLAALEEKQSQRERQGGRADEEIPVVGHRGGGGDPDSEAESESVEEIRHGRGRISGRGAQENDWTGEHLLATVQKFHEQISGLVQDAD